MDISKVKVGADEYDVKDASAREGLAALEARCAAVRPSGLYAVHDRFLTFAFGAAGRRSLTLREGTYIRLDITEGGVTSHRAMEADSDRTFDLSQKMHLVADASASRTGELNGRDFYLYLVPDGEGGVDVAVSCNSTFPNDVDPLYTALNTRKIGQFHTLCADAGAALTALLPVAKGSVAVGDAALVKGYKDGAGGFHPFYSKEVSAVTAGTYYDVATTAHPLAGFLAGDILPESVWCLGFHPASGAKGMVYDPETDCAVDIYLQSGTGRLTSSEFGATITDTRPQQNHEDDMRQVGKQLLSDEEFASAAVGSNERTTIRGGADPVTTGGHEDTSGRRMVSAIGCEDMCGVLWQWLRGYSANGGSSWGNYDGQGSLGQLYGASYSLLAGGDWNGAASCGSRCRSAYSARSRALASIAGRGASRVIRRS